MLVIFLAEIVLGGGVEWGGHHQRIAIQTCNHGEPCVSPHVNKKRRTLLKRGKRKLGGLEKTKNCLEELIV